MTDCLTFDDSLTALFFRLIDGQGLVQDCVSECENRTPAINQLPAQELSVVLGIEQPPVGAHLEVHSPSFTYCWTPFTDIGYTFWTPFTICPIYFS